MFFKDETYNKLKYVAIIVLPALGTFYFSLSSIWGLPYGEQVVGTITALDTLLGALLMISSNNYNKAQSLLLNDIEVPEAVEEESTAEEKTEETPKKTKRKSKKKKTTVNTEEKEINL